jgi:hypothetical protein
MSKMPDKLKYGERLADGRAVLKTFDHGETVKILFVGGTSIEVPSGEPVEVKAAK